MLIRGKLASQTGCNIETVRYCEKAGLIPAPSRSASGYRVYNDDHFRQLTFIAGARKLGFTIRRIRGLFEMTAVKGQHSRAGVKAFTEKHNDVISQMIKNLQKIRDRLKQISSDCDGSLQGAETCPILETLFDEQ